MKKVILLSLSTVLFFTFVSCQMGSGDVDSVLFPRDGGQVIAEFNGVRITDRYLATYIDQLNPYLKSRYNTPEKKEELISKIVEGELLAKYAIKKGALEDPALLSKIKSTIARYYTGTRMKIDIEESIQVTEEDMRKYYEENSDTYNQPERVKASHILIRVDENRSKAEAEKKARNVLRQARALDKDPRSFNQLVNKYSDDEGSKRRGGDLGYFVRTEDGGKMVQAFSDAAFALENVGDLSDLVETEHGFHIIRLTGRRDPIERSFDDVKRNIEQTLRGEMRKNSYENALENIKKEMGFKFYTERAAEVDLGIPDDVQQSSQKFDRERKVPSRERPKLDKEKLERIQEAIKRQAVEESPSPEDEEE